MRDVMTYIIFPPVLFLTLALNGHLNKGITDKAEPGGIAYEIYIWHNFAICIWMIISKKTGLIDLDNYSMMFVFTGLLILFSAGLYHFAEKRLTRYLKRKMH